MKFSELQQQLQEKLGIDHLADIARELGVSPQAVSNWKARDRVPYKYVIKIRERFNEYNNLNDIKSEESIINVESISNKKNIEKNNNNLVVLTSLILQNARNIIITPLVFIFFTFYYINVVYKPLYTSTAKILVPSTNSTSELSSFANRIGFDLNQPNISEDLSSLELLPELINSRIFTKNLTERSFYTQKYENSLKLLSILTHGKKKPTVGIDTLITIASGKLSNMITFLNEGSFSLLSVTTNEPKLSAEIANAVLEELSELNNYFFNQKVNEKIKYIDNRINVVEKELTEHENKLKIFRQTNRNIGKSPTLLLQRERLERNTEVHRGMFLTLKQQLEVTKIEEIQGRSVIQILDYPLPALSPSNQIPKKIYYLSIVFGVILGLGITLLKNLVKKQLKYNDKNINEIKIEFGKGMLTLLTDRLLYGAVCVLMVISLPILLAHRSMEPIFFKLYSYKALLIICFYLSILSSAVFLFFNSDRITRIIKKYKFNK